MRFFIMRYLMLLFLGFFVISTINAHDVSGVASNTETGELLAGFDILLIYNGGGIAASTTTAPDGTFTLTGVDNGTYQLEFYTYPDPVILDGDYFMNTTYDDDIVVNGANVTGIEFQIPPHHPEFTITGTLYGAVTNNPITIQNFEVRMKLQYYVEFFTDYATENGTFIISDLPDWTYEFNIFENDYYEGVETEVTIDAAGPDTIQIDFYLQPKSGATVSGILLDSTTNQPIMQAGRSIGIQAINSMFTETNSEGEFTFVNVPPGIYSKIEVLSEDTSFVNTTTSSISGFVVPDTGVSNVELYQKPWASIHEVTADKLTFEQGQTQTVTFSIVNDDLSYGAIWGVNLIFPDGITVMNTMPFYNEANTDVIFDELPDCSSNAIKAWEGFHLVGIPPYASTEGNLEELNEFAWSEVTLHFAGDTLMEEAPVFYEIYYDIHCFSIQPFSYGTIMMHNDNITAINDEHDEKDQVVTYPNPVSNKLFIDGVENASVTIYNISGAVMGEYEYSGTGSINVSHLRQGIYFVKMLFDNHTAVNRKIHVLR